MTEAARPTVAGSRGALSAAIRSGFGAFLTAAAIGQAIGSVVYAIGIRGFGLRLPLKLGWFYLLCFHRVGIAVTLARSPAVGNAPAFDVGRGTSVVHLAFLSATMLIGWVLMRAGREIGSRVGDVRERARIAGITAVAYGSPVGLLSLVITLRLPDAGVQRVHAVTWEAFALPLAFAFVCVAAGAASVPRAPGHRVPTTVSVATCGWRMFVWATVLMFGGFLVMAASYPAATAAYLRTAVGGRTGAMLAAHHVLLLPDQSTLMLAPALGGCDQLTSSDAEPATLCLRGVHAPGGPLFTADTGTAGGTLPFGYLAFLLVPVVATVGPARELAGTVRERTTKGAASGVVFAAWVVVASLASTISIEGSEGTVVALGPKLPRTVALALVWGVVGGALGAGFGHRRPGRQGDAEPPRPTSV